MPNNYTRKTDKGTASVQIYDLAFEEVTLRGKSLRDAASSYDLNYMSLSRYIKKKVAYQENPVGEAPSMGYATKNSQPNRRKIKSAVLTDTPTKDEIATIEANRKAKNVKKRVLSEDKKKPKKAKKTNKKKRTADDEEEAENNCFCLVCLEAYANSRSNEEWVQCIECKGWSHADCTGGELQYVCHNCLSD